MSRSFNYVFIIGLIIICSHLEIRCQLLPDGCQIEQQRNSRDLSDTMKMCLTGLARMTSDEHEKYPLMIAAVAAAGVEITS